MDHLCYDLGYCRQGDVVEVTLTRGANVRLFDSTNYRRYKRGERGTFHGGLAKRSPVHIAVPRAGTWHAVVDVGGLRGSTRASVQLIRRAA